MPSTPSGFSSDSQFALDARAWLETLVYAPKKKYATAYLRYLLGETPKPSQPSDHWAGKATAKLDWLVRQHNLAASPLTTKPSSKTTPSTSPRTNLPPPLPKTNPAPKQDSVPTSASSADYSPTSVPAIAVTNSEPSRHAAQPPLQSRQASTETVSRASSLVEYLLALHSMRESTPRTLQDPVYSAVIRADEAPEDKAVSFGTGEEWLRVSKPPLPDQPVLPSSLRDVTSPNWSETSEPFISPDVTPRTEQQAELKKWIQNTWTPWSKSYTHISKVRSFFNKLYEIRLAAQRDSATHEILWTHGQVHWLTETQDATTVTINHPLVITPVTLTYDSKSGDMVVTPDAGSRVDPTFLNGIALADSLSIETLRAERAVDPWDKEDITDLYQLVLPALSAEKGSVALAPPPTVSASPHIEHTWNLLMRRRPTNYAAFFRSLREQLLETGEVTSTMAALTTSGAPSTLSPEEETQWLTTSERLLFPLPSNKEQENIAQQLSKRSGVTVQGPPGTGKTHTIANLVSHLMAHGKRVLVTSQKEQPLEVLRDKLPADIRDLCVSVVGSSASSMAQLSQSVAHIQERAASIDPDTETPLVDSLLRELSYAEGRTKSLKSQLLSKVSQERLTFVVDGLQQPATEVAKWVCSNEDILGGIVDSIPEGIPLPLSTPQLGRLQELASTLAPADRELAVSKLPGTFDLPTGADLLKLTQDIRSLSSAAYENLTVKLDESNIDAKTTEELSDLEDRLIAHVNALSVRQPWSGKLDRRLHTNFAWRQAAEKAVLPMRSLSNELTLLRAQLAGHTLRLPTERLNDKALETLLLEAEGIFKSGKSPSRWLHRSVFTALRQCSVDEAIPSSEADVYLLRTKLRTLKSERELLLRWNQEMERLRDEGLPADSEYPEYELEENLQIFEDVVNWVTTEESQVLADLHAAGIMAPTPITAEVATQALAALRSVKMLQTRRSMEIRLDAIKDAITAAVAETDNSSFCVQLTRSFENSDWAMWDKVVAEVDRLTELRPYVQELSVLYLKLSNAAPIWAMSILRDPETLHLEIVEEMWQWARASTWLAALSSGMSVAELQAALASAAEEERRLRYEAVSASAWLHTAKSLTAEHKAALSGWSLAMKKVGKGTGKYAATYRQAAQNNLQVAREAIPVWVMPIHAILDSYDPRKHQPFDVVIVDESSQCDIFSLGLTVLGKKLVVVGDDKQTSPSMVGWDQSEAQSLAAKYISQLPSPELYGTNVSLYDTALRLFPSVVMLKEHFRSVPDIISFSNHRYYQGRIQPLRDSTSELPGNAVTSILVETGSTDTGTKVNRQEVDAVVSQVSDIVSNPAYYGKTLGVISFLDGDQAAVLQREILSAIGEREAETRKLRVGSAYHFQGDERDVMLMSLVVDADNRGHMTKESDQQRMNVAVTRARDQLFVFHSFLPGTKHKDDVREHLLQYCTAPKQDPRVTKSLEDKCDSPFEIEVLRRLLARNLNVIPQYPLAGKEIDFMVLGNDGTKLAVECDGERYHGPERYAADLERQYLLERVGHFTFVRIRGMDFYRNKDAALTPLWIRLEELGILSSTALPPGVPHG